MTQAQLNESEWVGHVHWAGPEDKVTELTFKSAKGSKHAAMSKVLEHFSLSSVNDPTIKGVQVQEISSVNTKVHTFGKELRLSDKDSSLEVATTSKFVNAPRYRVRMYATPYTADERSYNMRAHSPQDALHSMMGICSVANEQQVGAYAVEEQTRDGFILRLVKFPHRFPGIGQLDKLNDGTSNVTHLTPLNLGVKSNVNVVSPIPNARPQWRSGQVWSSTEHRWVDPPRPREQKISEILDILAKETKVTKKKYTVKKD